MRLVCPRCAAAYEVPPTLLGGRRAVRCARCGTEWVEHAEGPGEPEAMSTGPAEAPVAAEARAAVPLGVSARPRPSASRNGAIALRLAWAASVLALAVGTWEAVAWRGGVMRAWPPSQRLYAALGLARDHAAGSAPAPPPSSRFPRGKEETGVVKEGG
jgi:predicted Zn finger-like uncharacterized protein